MTLIRDRRLRDQKARPRAVDVCLLRAALRHERVFRRHQRRRRERGDHRLWDRLQSQRQFPLLAQRGHGHHRVLRHADRGRHRRTGRPPRRRSSHDRALFHQADHQARLPRRTLRRRVCGAARPPREPRTRCVRLRARRSRRCEPGGARNGNLVPAAVRAGPRAEPVLHLRPLLLPGGAHRRKWRRSTWGASFSRSATSSARTSPTKSAIAPWPPWWTPSAYKRSIGSPNTGRSPSEARAYYRSPACLATIASSG